MPYTEQVCVNGAVEKGLRCIFVHDKTQTHLLKASINYYEWQLRKNDTSWKEQIRQEIDKLIPTVASLDELLQLLEERGYEIKCGKYISLKAPGQERFVRTKTLGEEYTEKSLKIRITYHDVDTNYEPTQDDNTSLWAEFSSVLDNIRLLANQRRKVPCKRIVTAEYSAENDLDVYRLSAQLSVINQEHISSIGELEGRIARLRDEYEKLRGSEQKEKLMQIRQRYEVYCDIVKTYSEISKLDYISGIVENERQRHEQVKKKKWSR